MVQSIVTNDIRFCGSGRVVGNWEVDKILLSSSGLPVTRQEWFD